MTKINLTTEKYKMMHREYFIVQRNKSYKRKMWENELERKTKWENIQKKNIKYIWRVQTLYCGRLDGPSWPHIYKWTHVWTGANARPDGTCSAWGGLFLLRASGQLMLPFRTGSVLKRTERPFLSVAPVFLPFSIQFFT